MDQSSFETRRPSSLKYRIRMTGKPTGGRRIQMLLRIMDILHLRKQQRIEKNGDREKTTDDDDDDDDDDDAGDKKKHAREKTSCACHSFLFYRKRCPKSN